jgi:hypothetical protein
MPEESADFGYRIATMQEKAQRAKDRGLLFFYVRIPESLHPDQRKKKYDELITRALQKTGFAEVTGDERELGEGNAVPSCGVEVVLRKPSGAARGELLFLRGELARLGVPVGTVIEEFIPRFREYPVVLNPVHDPVLGVLTWVSTFGWWEFEAGPVGGHSVTGVLVPSAAFNPLAAYELGRIRRTVAWVRANDPAIRQHIATEMWDWWFESSGPLDRQVICTPEQFRDTLSLEVIRFDAADTDGFLDYADHGLVGNYGIRIYVSPDGRFTGGPEMC